LRVLVEIKQKQLSGKEVKRMEMKCWKRNLFLGDQFSTCGIEPAGREEHD